MLEQKTQKPCKGMERSLFGDMGKTPGYGARLVLLAVAVLQATDLEGSVSSSLAGKTATFPSLVAEQF